MQDNVTANPKLETQDHATLLRRVVVVRSEALHGRMRRILDHYKVNASVELVPSYLSAMGDIAVKPADVIIGPLNAMLPILQSTVKSIRKLSPKTRLLVLASSSDESELQTAIDAGVDICLTEPVEDAYLAEVMSIIPVQSAKSADASVQCPPPESPGDTDHADPTAIADSELGDIDLVEMLMHEPRRLPELAMKIVSVRSGIEGIRFLKNRENGDTSEGGAASPVAYNGRIFGILQSPVTGNNEQLPAWSAWLARWLALAEHVKSLEDKAMRDELTGAWNRRYFNQFLSDLIGRAVEDRSHVTLLVFDIDDFKQYNDQYGHAAGDEILQATARLMQSVVRDHDVVSRIGGDEFAVIFWDHDAPRKPNSRHPKDVTTAAARFRQAICEHRCPKLLNLAKGTLTISGGLAGFPWDGRTPEELLAAADAMLMKSKRHGKNVITFGPGAMRYCEKSD